MQYNIKIIICCLLILLPFNSFSFTNCGMNLIEWSEEGFYFYNDILNKLKQLNVNYVALNPWVFQDTAGSTNIYKRANATATDDSIKAVIDLAHSKNMQVVFKLHVWTTNNEWPGVIDPINKAAWFNSYKSIITQYAIIAEEKNVELFSVGLQMRSISGSSYYSYWTNVISCIKRNYSGELIYSANSDEFTNVSFWDHLDYIGIDCGIPLTANNNADVETIKAAWANCDSSLIQYSGKNWIAWITNYCRSQNKDFFFTEISYASANGAADMPWVMPSPPVNLSLQSNCYEAAFQVWQNCSRLQGMFWWECNHDIYAGGENDIYWKPLNKPAEKVLSKYYKQLRNISSTNTNQNQYIPKLLYPVNTELKNNKFNFLWSAKQSDFDWEDNTLMNWYPGAWWENKALSVYPFHVNSTEKAYQGTHSLKCHTVLTQGKVPYQSGEISVTLQQSQDLRQKTISVWMWVPEGLVRMPYNGFCFFLKEEDYTYHQLNWHNISEYSNWVMYSETVPDNTCYMNIKEIGIKIMANGSANGTEFDGYIYIDQFDFQNDCQYKLQVSDKQSFSSLFINESGLTTTNYPNNKDLSEDRKYYWRVKLRNFSGWQDWSDIKYFYIHSNNDTGDDKEEEQIKIFPTVYNLKNDPYLTIYLGHIPMDLKITIYDVSANVVKQWSNVSGRRSITWDGQDDEGQQLSTGMYMFQIKGSWIDRRIKIILIR